MRTFTRICARNLVAILAFSSLSGAKIECVAGCGQGPLNGPAAAAQLKEPFGVDFDRQGNWYICEYRGHRITRVDPAGRITLFAGTGEPSYGGDGGPGTEAGFNQPHSLYLHNGWMFIADTRNHVVRRMDLETGIIATIAGTGVAGYSGDGGPATAAQFNQTYDLALTSSGDLLYVADLANRRVRQVDLKSGLVRTVAGNGQQGVPEDGSDALSSPLLDPRALSVDAQGNLYILERRGNALRLLDREGKIRTLIAPGDFTPDLNGPKHLCLDLHGNVIIADTENHLIRKYSPTHETLVTIAGTGEKGNRLVPDDPLNTQLNRPHGVYLHPSGGLYISDSDNDRVLKLSGW